MTSLVAAIACFAAGALFDVQTIELGDPSAHVFLSDVDTDSTTDLVILSEHALVAYPSARGYRPWHVEFEASVSAFDIYDLDGDHQPEIVAVSHDRVLQYAFGAEAGEPYQVLFEAETVFSGMSNTPMPRVLAVPYKGEVRLALPTEQALVLYARDGTAVAEFAFVASEVPSVFSERPFSYYSTTTRNRLGASASALTFHVSRSIRPAVELPEELMPASIPEADTTALRDKVCALGLEDSLQWDLSRLTPGPENRKWLLCAPNPPANRSTWIRVCEEIPSAVAGAEPEFKAGPKHRYPGAVLASEDDVPDFNGDVYADLVLWQTPRPGTSVDSLTRALTGRTWPIRLTVHLFQPDRNRHEPSPSAHIPLRVPVGWLLNIEEDSPVQNLVLRDFDGDKTTDLGVSTEPNRFEVWLYKDGGFGSAPNFEYTFPEAISGLVFKADLSGKGQTAVALRTPRALYVLRPSM